MSRDPLRILRRREPGGQAVETRVDPENAVGEYPPAVPASGERPTEVSATPSRQGLPGDRIVRPRTTLFENEALVAGRLLVLAVAGYLALWLALQVEVVFAAVVIGFAEVSMLWPVARRLRGWGVPPVLAAVACVLGLSALFLALLAFVVFRVIAAWPELVASFSDALDRAQEWLQSQPFGIDTAVLQSWADQAELSLSGLVARAGSAAAAGAGAVSQFVTVLVVATFFAIFVLASGDTLWRQLLRALPGRYRQPAEGALRGGMRTAGNWFYASTVTGLVDGIFIGAGLYLLGVPLAVPLGALTFVAGYVPLVGATLAGALAVLVAFVTGGPWTALWALLIVLLVQQIEGNVLSPLLLSRAVSFHPAITLLLTTGAAAAFGLVGMFLAVPVAGILVAVTTGWRRARAPEPSPAASQAS